MPIRRCARCGKFLPGDGVSFDGRYYHPDCLVCSYCGGKLTGKAVSYGGKPYHPECSPASGKRVCAYCRKPLSGSYYRQGNKFYHKDCYHAHVEKRCVVCGEPLGGGTYTYDGWGNFAHLSHNGKTTRHCYSCGRIIAGSGRPLGGNKFLCSECAKSSVTTPAQIERCRAAVLSLFKELGITGVPAHIPIHVKSKDLLKGCEGHIIYPRSAKHSGDFHIEITEGLPELHFKGVLAHEMLHSWLKLYGREATAPEREGFCDLGCSFVYQRAGTQHARHLQHLMFKNSNEVYGGGYRLMKARYEKLGWAGLLDTLRK